MSIETFREENTYTFRSRRDALDGLMTSHHMGGVSVCLGKCHDTLTFISPYAPL